MTEATATEAPQQPLSVVVGHHPNGVTIHVQATGSCQGGLDTESIVAFLSALDAEQLEKDVMEGMGLLDGDGEDSYTKALLKRLVTIARGEW